MPVEREQGDLVREELWVTVLCRLASGWGWSVRGEIDLYFGVRDSRTSLETKEGILKVKQMGLMVRILKQVRKRAGVT